MSADLIDRFPALDAVAGLTHGFVCRHPEVDVKTDRDTAIARLQPHYENCFATLGFAPSALVTGEQVHSDHVEVCGLDGIEHREYPATDALVTNCVGQFLGIYVADCGAVYVVDPVKQAIGLAHSGKKGAEMGITARVVQTMKDSFGSDPKDLIVQISPCIRTPDYDIDFVSQIIQSARDSGVPENQIHDCCVSTSRDLDRYYSYRIEKGETGRLLAVLGWSA